MQKSTTRVLILFLAGIATGILIVSQISFRDGIPEKNENKSAKPIFYAPQLPVKMTFAGEMVPLEKQEIREMFDRELIYNFYSQGHMIYLLKLCRRYFPVIEPILKQQGLPDDFKFLCVAESNLQPLTSRVGAQGYWQFMKNTAPAYNLEVSSTVDERDDLVKSTVAACKYLKSAYNKFGNWTAAAASYNCGMGGYNSQATFQKTNNYYDLQLPTETNKYIFRILALKHILSNAADLGFSLDEKSYYTTPNLKKITVTKSIANLSDWARAQGSNYKLLKWYNPWLNDRSLIVKPGKQFEIILPE